MSEIQSTLVRQVIIPKDRLYFFSGGCLNRQAAIYAILRDSGFDMRYSFDVYNDVSRQVLVCTQREYSDFEFKLRFDDTDFTRAVAAVDDVPKDAAKYYTKRHIEKLK